MSLEAQYLANKLAKGFLGTNYIESNSRLCMASAGSGPFSLTGQPKAMGGREVGYMGLGLLGQRSVLVEEDRIFIEDLWGIPRGTLSTRVEKGAVAMFEELQRGCIKACWIICTNPVATMPNRKNVIAGLQAAELVITRRNWPSRRMPTSTSRPIVTRTFCCPGRCGPRPSGRRSTSSPNSNHRPIHHPYSTK
ncbi:MAG: hypothetical protein L0Y39_03295 [Methylococcaceae bacterium]|nr:hypothetical protein [Methylococcaceae bacterium]